MASIRLKTNITVIFWIKSASTRRVYTVPTEKYANKSYLFWIPVEEEIHHNIPGDLTRDGTSQT
jgi:hypothetical protein